MLKRECDCPECDEHTQRKVPSRSVPGSGYVAVWGEPFHAVVLAVGTDEAKVLALGREVARENNYSPDHIRVWPVPLAR